MKTKIAVLTDLHFSKSANPAIPERHGEFADILLLRAVRRLNRFIKPDLVFIGGDLVDRPNPGEGRELLPELKKIIDLLEAPTIVINGNHDPEIGVFKKIMGKPADFLDINGIRFVPFFDPERPGYNAFRTPEEIARMRQLGAEFNGPLVSLQHVPLFPPEPEANCPYNYTNADEIIKVMREANYVLALSGHYHEGFAKLDHRGMSYIAGPALCENRFGYTVIEIDERGKASCLQENLAMPEELRLVDCHVHTRLAYCNENMDIAKSISLGQMFGLDGIVISEHSAHLYFNLGNYSRSLNYLEGLEASEITDRTPEYFSMYAAEANTFCRLGMEVDYDCRGRKVIRQDAWNKLEFRNGSVHFMDLKNPDMKAIEKEFLFLNEAALASGIDALVHPFRIFRRRGMDLPRHLFAPLVELLKRYRCAAEINYHTNEPPAEFFRMCIENGVKLTLGSDAHNLYEVGEFYPHLKFLREIAPDYEIPDLLIR
ncbi:MAG: metallophosphoesterase [Victivallaceae bacterium]|nr:metallophosphoesterase [Victivallaceae bacterium]